MKIARALVLTSLCFASPAVAAAEGPDARMNAYFSIWAANARITPEAVDRLYARHVIYYGKPMTTAAVYRDKLNFIRRWPSRTYSVLPGSVSKTCDPAETRCRVTAVLNWQRKNTRGGDGSSGANTVVLDLVREDGTLKVAREHGSQLVRADCRGGRNGWSCSGYR